MSSHLKPENPYLEIIRAGTMLIGPQGTTGGCKEGGEGGIYRVKEL